MAVVGKETATYVVGRISIDKSGSLVSVVRVNVDQAYAGVPELLMQVIDKSSTEAWHKIKDKINYIHSNLDYVLGWLDRETGFGRKVKAQVKAGKKLLFKPNLVNPVNIDPFTHSEGAGNTACTQWPLVAAVMRWFHDRLGISYHQMALGEAASLGSMIAAYYSLISGKHITTEAVIEGRSGDFYGGWGFYFVRRYLAETHPEDHDDDPMNGLEDSVLGRYLPPGEAGRRLMVYDLNRIYDVKGKGRAVPVPDGANFKEIILHKVIVGGNRQDPDDCKQYPGCVLVNLPRLKIHAIDLITNAIKNLGIGLYPLEVAVDDGANNRRWKYGFPHKSIPNMKTEIPHQLWVPAECDEIGLPLRDESGAYVVTKTGGMSATQADVIRAVQNQGMFMVHIVDAIEAVNLNHTGGGTMAVAPSKVAEGLILASLDPVALDCLCARYMFQTVPLVEARALQQEHKLGTDFLQRVPVAKIDGANIVTCEGVDSPLLRYDLFRYCETRGLGKQKYHVKGWDAVSKTSLISVGGHLGWLKDGKFAELMTNEFYHNPTKFLWDCQRSVLSYLEANDKLTGSNYREEVMAAFDEDGDGVIDYNEMGKKGAWHTVLRLWAHSLYLATTEELGFLRTQFLLNSWAMRYSDPRWNDKGYDFTRELRLVLTVYAAFQMSRLEAEVQDQFFPNIVFGNGKWPSLQLASYIGSAMSIYGRSFPLGVDLQSLYGCAFQYADKKLNGGKYTGSSGLSSHPEAVNRYVEAASQGAQLLDFVLFVPIGLGNFVGKSMPNAVETTEPGKVFTAQFDGCKQTWS